jgi:3-oxoacyl-[acyl-carrier protein] reductase
MHSMENRPSYPDLNGKVAVVTGGSRGIGAETARTLAANGVRVLVTGRDRAALDAALDAIRADGGTAVGVVADGTDQADVERTRDRAVAEFGRVDVLAAFVGSGRARPGLLHETGLDDFRSTVDGNLTATFLALAAFLPGMVDRGGGAVVTMSSVAARRTGTGAPLPYSAAKSGVETLTAEVAAQYGRYGVRANCVAPSTVLTERTERNMPPEFRDRVTALHALGRLGRPEDVANTVAFLASDASSWLTGLVIDVAGGR